MDKKEVGAIDHSPPERDRYPLEKIENLLDSLNGSTYFISLAMRSGYSQIAMHRIYIKI